jgi:GAF domain-containing protein
VGEVTASTGMAAIMAGLASPGSGGLAAVSPRSCAEVLGMTGVAVTVLITGGGQELIWRTDGISARLDDLQFTLGQGPTVDVAASGELVLESDLAQVPWRRWPVFTPAALELGVQAVFAVPLQIGAIRLGVLLAHRVVPGPMRAGVLADMLIFADAAMEALLGAGDAGLPSARRPVQTSGYRAEVHQATGMISVQLSLTQADALIRMRAYAFSERRTLAEVAADIVARTLRFDLDL